jgi:thiamine-monophosphate kinase
MGMLSEDGLIGTISRVIRPRGNVRLGIGDDACVLKDGTVVTTDAYADRVHFDLRYMTWEQVGARCACGAISDVVAMAARPGVVLVALSLPRQKGSATVRDVRALYRGIEGVCREMGCEVAGGDIIVADRLQLALTVTGKTRAPRLRSGAKPGDWVYVTGHLGAAEAGRMLLAASRNGGLRAAGKTSIPLIRRHLRPVPRLAVMKALKSRMHGLIDTSDGIAADAGHVCSMSRVRIVLQADALPVLPGTERLCARMRLDPVDFVLGAGEDYELLFTSPSRLSDSINGVKVTKIGQVEAGRGLWVRRCGQDQPVTNPGYDHLLATTKQRDCSQDVDNAVDNRG